MKYIGIRAILHCEDTMEQINNVNNVKYHNDMNLIAFKNFTSRELNIFFVICGMMKDRKVAKVKFRYEEIKHILSAEFPSNAVFEKTLKSVYDKLLHLEVAIDGKEKFTKFVLFTAYEIDYKEKTIEIATNEHFYYYLNEITKNFTMFELQEFSSLRSSYSKNLYRLLKQYRSTGRLYLTVEEFRRLLDIPDTYQWYQINLRVLKAIQKELTPIFHNLTLRKIKKGRVITHIEYTFTPERRGHLKKASKVINPGTLLCPLCGQPLELIQRNDGGSFFGHRDYQNGFCKATFTTLEEYFTAKPAEAIEIESESEPMTQKSEEDILQGILNICRKNEAYIQYIGTRENNVITLNKTKLRENEYGLEEPTIETYPITEETICKLKNTIKK